MKNLVAILLVGLSLGACGAGQASDADTTSSDEGAGSSACEGYSSGDACIDDTNLAQCREMASRCPGEVVVMESCPLQFGCP